MLNRKRYEYKCCGEIMSHRFHMDNPKLYAKNEERLEIVLQRVCRCDKRLNITFGLENRAKATLKIGELVKTSDTANKIWELDEN